MCLYIWDCMYIYTHIFIYIYVCVYIYTHTCRWLIEGVCPDWPLHYDNFVVCCASPFQNLLSGTPVYQMNHTSSSVGPSLMHLCVRISLERKQNNTNNNSNNNQCVTVAYQDNLSAIFNINKLVISVLNFRPTIPLLSMSLLQYDHLGASLNLFGRSGRTDALFASTRTTPIWTGSGMKKPKILYTLQYCFNKYLSNNCSNYVCP
jgi:hypothetical protein